MARHEIATALHTDGLRELEAAGLVDVAVEPYEQFVTIDSAEEFWFVARRSQLSKAHRERAFASGSPYAQRLEVGEIVSQRTSAGFGSHDKVSGRPKPRTLRRGAARIVCHKRRSIYVTFGGNASGARCRRKWIAPSVPPHRV